MRKYASMQNHFEKETGIDIIIRMENKILIKKSKRKTISIQVLDDGTVQVKAPLRCSDKNIWQFVNSKSSWIQKQIDKTNKKQLFASSFDFEKNIYVLGKIYLKPAKFSYNKTAQLYLPKIADDIANRLGYSYKELKLKHSKRTWGRFSSTKQLMLNKNCIVLPLKLLEYVIIHEFCHSKEMNHSPKFWQIVESHLPDYKKRKEALKNYTFLLNLKLQ